MAKLKRFDNGLAVKVIEHDDSRMVGNIGKVVRLRISDNGAWVRMEKRLTDSGDFPFSEPDERANHTLLYPDQCEKVTA